MADVKFDDLPEVTDPQDDDIIPMDEDSSGNTSYIKYKNLMKMAGKVNLLKNSGFGVWSNSDTNKGLSRGTPTENVSVDSGSTLPVVGETLTGATSNALGKVISITDTGGNWGADGGTATLSLGACTGRFQNDEDLDGSAGGGNICTLNMPPTAAGVDLVRNGDFTADEDPPQGWTAVNAILSTEGGGDVGNCMKVLDGGAGNGYGYQSITIEIGKLYTFSCYAKDIDTGNNGYIEIGTVAGAGEYYSSRPITDDAGDTYTATFEATTTTAVINLWCVTLGGTYYYDSVFLYEITPCCTEVDAKAPDGWEKTNTLDIYRQHNDATYTTDGSFYSCKVVKTVATAEYLWFDSQGHDIDGKYQQWLNIAMALGAAIYSVGAADNVKLAMYHNGSWSTLSSNFAAAGAWEWQEISATINAASTDVRFGFLFDGDIGDVAYIQIPMLIFGSSIGNGNYVLAPGEWVNVDPDQELHLVSNGSPLAVDDKILNVEAVSEGTIPKGCKRLQVRGLVNNSAVADGEGVTYGPSSTYPNDLELFPQINDVRLAGSGIVRCDSNGDIYQQVTAAGNTLYTQYLRVGAVQVS